MNNDEKEKLIYSKSTSELVLGSTILGLSSVNEGTTVDKIFVLFGFLFIIVATIRLAIMHINKKEKMLAVCLFISSFAMMVTFIGLLYRLIFA